MTYPRVRVLGRRKRTDFGYTLELSCGHESNTTLALVRGTEYECVRCEPVVAPARGGAE